MKESSKLQPRFWITVLVVAAALWGLYPYLLDKSLDHFGLNWRVDRRGQFGDSFGPLSALFTAWACILITWVLYLQRQELRMHQAELMHMNEVLEDHARSEKDSGYITGLAALAQYHQKRATELEGKGDKHGSEHESDEAQRRKQQLAEYLDKLAMKHRL
ncbi:hypothetical protein OAM01_01895 [bacterium]|nr:hypothetical protein [bacterium]